MWGLVPSINSEKFSDNLPSFRVVTSSWGFDGMNADSASEVSRRLMAPQGRGLTECPWGGGKETGTI